MRLLPTAKSGGFRRAYLMTALHSGTFAGAPPTNKRVHWEEIAVLHFNDEGKCTDGWFMCQELSLASQTGYKLKLQANEGENLDKRSN